MNKRVFLGLGLLAGAAGLFLATRAKAKTVEPVPPPPGTVSPDTREFDFGTPVVSRMPDPTGSLWTFAEVSLVISNPHDSKVTRNLTVWWGTATTVGPNAGKPFDVGQRNWQDGNVWMAFTLEPGESRKIVSPLLFPGPHVLETNSPAYAAGSWYYYYFADDLGNRSEIVS